MEIEKLFKSMKKHDASDMHLKKGQPPLFRISTTLKEVGDHELSPDEIQELLFDIMTPEQIEEFEEEKDLDFAYGMGEIGRYRINIFKDRGDIAAAIRRVESEIPGFDELHLPSSIEKIAKMGEGLVIFVGPTGEGKSTTMSAILQRINETRKEHIITIEDPIEYLLTDEKSIISQREIGIDVKDFKTALRTVVRQDPDVILLGELRDEESINAGLTAAETGHLVFGTLHASNCPAALSRIVDMFPPEQTDQIRKLLMHNLKGIVSQKLIPSCRESVEVVPAVEILFVNSMVRKLLKEKKDNKLHSVIRSSREEGMQDFNQSIVDLLNNKLITKKSAFANSPNPDQLKMKLQGIDLGEEKKIIGRN